MSLEVLEALTNVEGAIAKLRVALEASQTKPTAPLCHGCFTPFDDRRWLSGEGLCLCRTCEQRRLRDASDSA
jgi:hypothetical protein